MTTIDVSGIAATAEKVVEGIAAVEGPALAAAGVLIPGAATVTVPLQAILPLVIPDIERALNDVAAGNGGDIWLAVSQFVNHITKGKPNSPILSPATPAT